MNHQTPAGLISLALAGLLVFIKPPVAASTYYISQSSGDDRSSGQAGHTDGGRGPWKTLARASTNYVAGDIILLKSGDKWNEELHPHGSGTSANPILISSYGEGPRPVIDRQDCTKDRVGIHLSDQEGFKIVGLEFARCLTGIYGDYSEGCPIKKSIWIEDCYFHDALFYQQYRDYPRHKIGLGICFFSHERHNTVVLADVTVKNCVFRRLASSFWTVNPDNFNPAAGNIYNFSNLTFEGCLFEAGYQWPLGIRGVDGGAVRNCVTHDIGRGFRAFNGVAGAMFARCKKWIFEDSEWGFIDLGQGSGDGEAFDFESNCDHMIMRNCLFHDTDGPGFLLCCHASGPEPETAIRMENCVLNGKSRRPNGLPRCEIINTTDANEASWTNCRFYLSPGEVLMKVMDPQPVKRSSFVNCVLKDLRRACSTPNLARQAAVSASSEAAGNMAFRANDGHGASFWKAAAATNQWLQLDFNQPTAINEFRLKEAAGSSVIRYVIEYWDDQASRWTGCFNGRTIGPDFIAPIVRRTTRKVRLRILRTTSGDPEIRAFEVYHDTTGEIFNDPIDATAVGQRSAGSTPGQRAYQAWDAPWRQAAADRIEKYRKADLAVGVVDTNGKPVPNAIVQVKMTRQTFPFASCVSGDLLVRAKGPDADRYRQMVDELFSHVTMEWETCQIPWEQDKLVALDALKWLKDHGKTVHGCHILWPNPEDGLPKDIVVMTNDPPAMRKRLLDHLDEKVTHCMGLVSEWNAVNELYSNRLVEETLGKPFVLEIFKRAKQIDPVLRLDMNDFGDVANADEKHIDGHLAWVRYAREHGARMDVVGLQCHFNSFLRPMDEVYAILERFAALGYPIHISELDVNLRDESFQADFMRDILTLLYSHPAVEKITLWGFWEGRQWMPQAALWRKDWTIKPIGKVWLNLVKTQWRTNVELPTDGDGTAKVRAFLGDYEITARAGGMTAQTTVKVGRDGAALTLRVQ